MTPRALPRQDPLARMPVLLLLPHSRCNCHCVMCDIWRDPARHEVSAHTVAAWLDELRRLRVERVVLSGGEPLMHSNLWALCRPLRDQDIAITLLTTGLLLRRHAAALGEYADEVIVSLDGPPEIHDRIRGQRAAFSTMAAGVAAVRDAHPQVAIAGRCTVQRLNCLELRATVRAASGIGLDRISFLAVDVDTESFNRPGGWDTGRVADVLVAADQLPGLSDEITALEREHAHDFARGFIVESPDKLRRRILRHFAAVHGRTTFAPMSCNAPWVSSVVEADGTVRPCFFHPPLGNVHESGSLEAVVNSPAAVAFRRGLDPRTNPVCRRCVCSLRLRRSPAGPAAEARAHRGAEAVAPRRSR